jgi:hypothetical protein
MKPSGWAATAGMQTKHPYTSNPSRRAELR